MQKLKWCALFNVAAIVVVLVGSEPAMVNAAARPAANFPPNPTADIVQVPVFGSIASVADVQSAFNNARATENTQLGLSIPPMVLPSQATWDLMDNNARALWLVNQERIDRMTGNPGLLPLQGTEPNVTGIAQYYANYLLANNVFSHNADGNDPWQRLNTNPAINACHDNLDVAENIYVSVNSENSFNYAIEQAVYEWMYVDGSSAWGHREAILWYPYTDNNGQMGQEGFMGIGQATGGPYQGPFTESWPFATLIVMNVFDPCATWPTPRVFLPATVKP